MARKDESILNLLVECPWWVSLEEKEISLKAQRKTVMLD
jgi:hypothetical protein